MRTTPLSQKLVGLAADATIVVAHRGDGGSFPENTLPAFRAAIHEGAGVIEFDIRQTQDGILVCIHDEALDRTSDSATVLGREKVRVQDVAFSQLAELDAGGWKDPRFAGTRIPSLEAGLEVIQDGSIAMIEHKAGDPAVLVDLLRRMDLVDDVLVQSFDWEWLEQVHALEPELTIGALGGYGEGKHLTDAMLPEIAATGAALVHWDYRSIREQDVRKLHALGYLVCVFTIDAPEDYRRAVEMGIDLITTNEPGRLRDFLARNR